MVGLDGGAFPASRADNVTDQDQVLQDAALRPAEGAAEAAAA